MATEHPDGVKIDDDPSRDTAGESTTVSGDSFVAHVLHQEAASGGSELARAINDALRALARAARSFLLYDPHNDAIRGFLQSYDDEMRRALHAVDAQRRTGVELEIRPFEMLWDGEVVYKEEDRERSLAYRMFRDGVRRLTLGPQTTWEELVTLLRILSIRYTGVRLQEEDIVTLLWKAGFKNIEIVAVEGFVPVDADVAEETSVRRGAIAGRGEERGSDEEGSIAPPLSFDLPIPDPLPMGRVLPAPVPEEELQAIHHQATSRPLPLLCVRLLTQMLALVADREDPTDWPHVAHLIEEVRDFLLAEGQLGHLTDVVRALEDLRAHDPRQVDLHIAGFVDARALRRIVHSVPPGGAQLPPELARLLDSLPGHHVEAAIDVIVAERSPAARQVGRQIIARFAETDPDLILDRITAAEPEVAADLLVAVSQAMPRRRFDAARRAIARGTPDLVKIALEVLGKADDSPELHAELAALLANDDSDVRQLVLEQITGRHCGDLFDDVRARFETLSHGEMRSREADAFGKALMSLDPDRALPLLSEWIRPPSVFKRLFQGARGSKWQRWAAVSGLGIAPQAEADQRIQWLEERAGEDLARHCRRVRASRRQERRHV